ncbi:hypothetical protein V6Z11_D04G134600 [Gossypium hirsutum]
MKADWHACLDNRVGLKVNNSRGAEHDRDDEDDFVAKMKAAEEALEAKQKVTNSLSTTRSLFFFLSCFIIL